MKIKGDERVKKLDAKKRRMPKNVRSVFVIARVIVDKARKEIKR